MRGIRFLLVAAVVASCFTATVPQAKAQVAVEVGVAPECPYGYFDAAPYDCAPAGYYGPEWFTGDVFVGAGPWFHGKTEFRGKVDNSFDPQKGYKGAKPNRGEKAEPTKRVDSTHFKGNEERDGRGHATEAKAEGKPQGKQ
jgi:hypothetical protein